MSEIVLWVKFCLNILNWQNACPFLFFSTSWTSLLTELLYLRNDNWSRTQLQLNLYHDDTRLNPLINVPSYVEAQHLATTKKSRKWFQKSVCRLPALSRGLNMGTLSYRNRIFCNEKSSGLTDLDLTCAWLLG